MDVNGCKWMDGWMDGWMDELPHWGQGRGSVALIRMRSRDRLVACAKSLLLLLLCMFTCSNQHSFHFPSLSSFFFFILLFDSSIDWHGSIPQDSRGSPRIPKDCHCTIKNPLIDFDGWLLLLLMLLLSIFDLFLFVCCVLFWYLEVCGGAASGRSPGRKERVEALQVQQGMVRESGRRNVHLARMQWPVAHHSGRAVIVFRVGQVTHIRPVPAPNNQLKLNSDSSDWMTLDASAWIGKIESRDGADDTCRMLRCRRYHWPGLHLRLRRRGGRNPLRVRRSFPFPTGCSASPRGAPSSLELAANTIC